MTYQINSAWATGYHVQIEDCNLNPNTDVVVRIIDSREKVYRQATVNRNQLVAFLLKGHKFEFGNENGSRLEDWERDLLGPQTSDGEYWYKRAMEAEAERDAHAATIGRVRALAWFGSYTADYVEQKIRAALDTEWEEFTPKTDESIPDGVTWVSVASKKEVTRYYRTRRAPEPFVLPTEAGAEFWAMGPNEDYWTSFITFTDGTNVLYIEQETSETVALSPRELRERYDQFKPIEAMHEVAPGVARLLDGAE